MCEVINVKKKNLNSIGYQNIKEWLECEDNVYIGRYMRINVDGKLHYIPGSIFKNPFTLKQYTRSESLHMYENYLLNKLHEDKHFLREFLKLRNKKLGCWCKPEKCHGDIILKILNILCDK